MSKHRILALLLLVFTFAADRDASDDSMLQALSRSRASSLIRSQAKANTEDTKSIQNLSRGALVSTRFSSFEALKAIIQLEYFNVDSAHGIGSFRKPLVSLTHASNGQKVTSILKSGVSEIDFSRAQRGGLGAKIALGLRYPYAAINRTDLLRVAILSRRRPNIYKEGDVAFYDLALKMVYHISDYDRETLSPKDFTDKGFLNTFNHFNSQAFLSSIFSENFADFIADAHERANMPELIHGNFTEAQLNDLSTGPVDNYVDLINNEWGQEFGKKLKQKYQIDRNTIWTPPLLADYLNDIQIYYSWAFHIGLEPFTAEDEIVIRFAHKINRVMEDVSGLR